MMMMRKEYGQRGIAAVEFGLILPIVLVILFAIFEFGTAFWRRQVLVSAVARGARAGIVATSPKKSKADIEAIVLQFLTDAGYTDGNRTATATGAQGASGSTLTVQATYPSSFLILSRLPLGGLASKVDGSGQITLSATIAMQME